jgi:hypothetical protein
MTKIGRFFAVLGVALTIAARAHAQGLPGADTSLKGLERVYVEFAATSLKPETQEKFSSIVKLELRKAGLRIVGERNELDLSRDATVLISFAPLDRSPWPDLSLEWAIVQRVTLPRTGEAIPAVTWRKTDEMHVSGKGVETMLRGTMDKFLNSWLSANGR